MSRTTLFAASLIGIAALGATAAGAYAEGKGKLGVSRMVYLPDVLPGHPLNGQDLGLEDREVLLTFDDGPNAWTTPGVLAALDAEGVKATFFMLGKNARQYPDMARRVLAAGHNVGSHTFSHTQLSTLNKSDANAEMQKGLNAVRAALPGTYHSRLFRFPYLDRDPALLQITSDAGLAAIDVDVTGEDYTGNACAVSVAKIMWQLEKVGRGIILMHDVQANTPCEIKMVLASLKLLNFRVVHLRLPNP